MSKQFMYDRHKIKVVCVSVLLIFLSISFLGFQFFLDGTTLNQPVKYFIPKADDVKILNSGVLITGDNGLPTILYDGIKIEGVYQVKLQKKDYKVGEPIIFNNSFCRLRNIVPTVQWTFINDINLTLGIHPSPIVPTGCYQGKEFFISNIPDEFSAASPNAKYRLFGLVAFQVNPLRKVYYLLESNYFCIVK